MQTEIKDFSKKQLKYINYFFLALCSVYEIFTLMTEFDTDWTDGLFMLVPIFVAILVKLRYGIYCYLPRFLFKSYYCILQIFGCIMNKNIRAQEGITLEIMRQIKAILVEYCSLVIPVLIITILAGIFKDKVFDKVRSDRKKSALYMTLLFFICAMISVFLMHFILSVGINIFLSDLFEPYKFKFFSPLMISFEVSVVILSGFTFLFYYFRDKICKGEE